MMDTEILDLVKAFTPAFLGVVGIVITVIFSAANKKLNHQKMEKELFSEFNKRYDEFNDSLDLLDTIATLSQLKEIDSLIEKKKMYHLLIDYFNLCAEQYYWYKKKRISAKLWESWHSGMMYYYRNYAVFRELWEAEIAGDGYKSYYLEKGKDFFKSK
ncbi:hypothetical protein M8998_03800 [Sphingobacterium sp. lm-10]|uniref:hypothetical protein n=1 Tax=Sphingobacterium sp. lm-10 TaxID=2944904 RepID=UPI00202256B1|nr:hypothetical protein [Sphingobacterium sp. lm-10]MCL7987062.1 hypothetical protein [Sphingobacterium sp. lm-10]